MILTKNNELSFTLGDIMTGAPCARETTLKLSRDENNITAVFTCVCGKEPELPYSRYNDPIYRGEVVEFFIGVRGDDLYYEFDLAPNDTLFNAKILYTEKYGAFTKVIDERYVTHFVEKFDGGYSATLTVPLFMLGEKEGEFVFNGYRISAEDGVKEIQAVSPTGKIDFHVPDKFLRLIMKKA